jgi:hypothetical protein
MPTNPSQNTDRTSADIGSPLAVTVQRACELTGSAQLRSGLS